jgi:hypothetical protein
MDGIKLGFVVCWAIFVGYQASRRRRNPYLWFFLSMVITPLISMVILFSIKNNAKKVKIPCPACGELVSAWDAICGHCNHSLATDTAFVESAKKAQNMSSEEVEEKNRVATDGYEAFEAGNNKSENPYKSPFPVNEVKASYWERGFAVAERKKGRGEEL